VEVLLSEVLMRAMPQGLKAPIPITSEAVYPKARVSWLYTGVTVKRERTGSTPKFVASQQQYVVGRTTHH